MKTLRTNYAVINGGIHPVYRYKDNRIELKKNLKDVEDHKPGTFLYLLTLLFISSALLLCMKVADLRFEGLREELMVDEQLRKAVNTVVDEVPEMEIVEEPIKYASLNISHNLANVAIDEISPQIIEEVEPRAILTPEELEFVQRVVEAEVTGTSYKWNGKYVSEDEMLLAKIRVCQVFLNRADDTSKFARINSLYEAVSEDGASSTVGSGRYLNVEVTDLTRQAVAMALDPSTEDLTDGALFFLSNGAKENPYGDYLFTDPVGHSFFK